MSQDNTPQMIVGSRTQSAETIQELLSKDYEGIAVTTQSDAAAETPAPVSEPEKPAEEKPADDPAGEHTDSSAPSGEAGPDGDGHDEEDEPAGPDGDGSAATDAANPHEHKEGKKPSGSAKAKAKIARLEAELEEVKRRFEESEKRQTSPKQPEITIPEAEPEPDPDDFDNGVYDPAYIKALASWDRKNAQREELIAQKAQQDTEAEKAAKEQSDAEGEAIRKRWAEQVEIGKSRHDDWEAVMEKTKGMEAAVPLTEAIQDSDMSGELVYHLATHPDELKRLNQLLALPQSASKEEFRKKMRLAHRELDKLEALVSQGTGGDEPDDGVPAETAAAAGSEEIPSGEKPPTTEPARESRPAATPSQPAAPAAAKPAAQAPKAKPEPVKPVGSRGGAIRPKRIQDMTREEIHSMQVKDPDGFRKLVEASRN